MRKHVKLRRRLLDALELPQEILGDIPKVTLLGGHVLVENHGGIFEYSPGVIRLHTRRGLLKVTGEELKLREFANSRAYIEGRVDALEFER